MSEIMQAGRNLMDSRISSMSVRFIEDNLANLLPEDGGKEIKEPLFYSA
jgi:hypothetical protein